MSEQARKFIKENYSFEKACRSYADEINTLTGNS